MGDSILWGWFSLGGAVAGFHVLGGGDVGLSEEEDMGDTSVDILGPIEGGPPGDTPADPPLDLPPIDCCMRQ